MFERLNAEQEKTLWVVRRLDRRENNEDAIRTSARYASEALDALCADGYVFLCRFGPQDALGEPSKRAYALTSKGRTYWHELWRWRFVTYFPIILSGLLGILGTVAGVLLEHYPHSS